MRLLKMLPEQREMWVSAETKDSISCFTNQNKRSKMHFAQNEGAAANDLNCEPISTDATPRFS